MPVSILSIISVGTNQGEAMLNRWDYVNPDGATDLTGIMAAFVTNVLGAYKARCHPAVQWTELLYRIVTDPLSPQQVYPITPAQVGTNGAGTPAPSLLCATARWALGPTVVLTAEAPQRRVRRGGKHFGGMTEDFTDGNTLYEIVVPGYETICEAYLGMSDGGFIPCVTGHPKRLKKVPGTPPVPDAPPNKYALITGFSINRVVGSTVSRKPGHGN